MRFFPELSLCLLLCACTSRGGSADRFGGDTGPHDGGAGLDATTTGDGGMPMDGAAPTDGAMPHDGATPMDGATPTDAGASCMAMLTALPPEAVPRCSAATHSCIDGCLADAGTGSPVACVVACEHADSTPAYTGGGAHLDCAGCLNYEQRHCIDMMGCHTAVAALDCCVAANCPDGSCVSSTCMTQYDAYAMCAMATAGPCVSMPTAFGVTHCFADATP